MPGNWYLLGMLRDNMTDQQRDSHALTWSTAAILVVYLVVVALHNGLYHQLLAIPGPNPTLARVVSNVSATVVMLSLVSLLRVSTRHGWLRAGLALLLAAVFSAAVRGAVLDLFDTYKEGAPGPAVADMSLGLLVLLGAGALGFSYMVARRRFRIEEQRAGEERLHRELALVSLGKEEVRVRRSVAEGLHGGLQQRLVLQVVRLDRAISQARERGAADDEIALLTELRVDLDLIREQDVRQMSRLLYPDGIEVGVVPAIRMLLRRLPSGIGTRLEVSAEFRDLDDPACGRIAKSERLLLVRIVEETITNALRHGHANGLEIWLGVDLDAVVVEVLNDGRALGGQTPDPWGGLSRLASRVELAGGELSINDLGTGGAGLSLASGAEMVMAVRCRLPLANAPEGV